MDYKSKTWKDFSDVGMLWFVNRILHVFHWVITIDENGVATPARTDVLGFSEETDERKQKAFLDSMLSDLKS